MELVLCGLNAHGAVKLRGEELFYHDVRKGYNVVIDIQYYERGTFDNFNVCGREVHSILQFSPLLQMLSLEFRLDLFNTNKNG